MLPSRIYRQLQPGSYDYLYQKIFKQLRRYQDCLKAEINEPCKRSNQENMGINLRIKTSENGDFSKDANVKWSLKDEKLYNHKKL